MLPILCRTSFLKCTNWPHCGCTWSWRERERERDHMWTINKFIYLYRALWHKYSMHMFLSQCLNYGWEGYKLNTLFRYFVIVDVIFTYLWQIGSKTSYGAICFSIASVLTCGCFSLCWMQCKHKTLETKRFLYSNL